MVASPTPAAAPIPKNPTAPMIAPTALSDLAALPEPKTETPAAALPPPAAPESSDKFGTAHTTTAAKTDAAAPPPLPPSAPSIPNLALAPPPIPGGSGKPAATTLPEIKVAHEKPAQKTWETKLAPAIVPPATNFNYRRELLPETVYRTSYDAENQHLPLRTTRDDYTRLLFTEAARNNINATRALLNAGADATAKTADGESLRVYAENHGATDTVRLLDARGIH
jgi:hypothetical protein